MNEFETQPSFGNELGSFAWETIKIIVISLAIILPIRYYLVQPFFVKGASMEPNFHDKDYILVDKLSYRVSAPQRGDVVVFRYPLDPTQYFIKRIIGLPGETVEIKNNQIFIHNAENPNGFALDESYLPNYNDEPMENLTRKVGPTEFFVMGDNRPHSSDSRRWGNLDKSFLAGKALFRLWPFNAVEKVTPIVYPTS